jgi:hypothetical protein
MSVSPIWCLFPIVLHSAHIDPSAGFLLFSEVFDLPYLRSTLRQPILEWADIKTEPSDETSIESIGCWSAWATGNVFERQPRYNTFRITEVLGLDISYTAVPPSTRRQPQEGGEHDWGLLFWHVAALIYPSPDRSPLSRNLKHHFPSSRGIQLTPDTHLTCFDMLYFVTAGREDAYEWTDPWNPSWREVGRHMKFTDNLVNLVKGYLRKVFRIYGSMTIPPVGSFDRVLWTKFSEWVMQFIGVHVRHGDFGGSCARINECFAPLSDYAAHVSDIQRELLQKSGIRIPDHHVLVTSGMCFLVSHTPG